MRGREQYEEVKGKEKNRKCEVENNMKRKKGKRRRGNARKRNKSRK